MAECSQANTQLQSSKPCREMTKENSGKYVTVKQVLVLKGFRKIAKVNRAKTSAKTLNKKLKALQRTVASLKAGQPVTEPKE